MPTAVTDNALYGDAVICGLSVLEVYGEPLIAAMRVAVAG